MDVLCVFQGYDMAPLDMMRRSALVLGVLACSQRPPILPHHVTMLWADIHETKLVFGYIEEAASGENLLLLTETFSRQVMAGEVTRNVIIAGYQVYTFLFSTIYTTVTVVTVFYETVKLHL